MGWAYSCLKLREFYPDVELYTDTQGAKLLIDRLGLPYTNCRIRYDRLGCNPAQWAYAKILTYSEQQSPFIHIDGDVFVWEKFDDKLLTAGIIAQNPELSTDYYKQLFAPILKNTDYIPAIFKKNLTAKYPKSYNAGILGGNDIELLQKYAGAAVDFFGRNPRCHYNGNFNMIFEQLLFHSVVHAHKATVGCYYGQAYNDNGYDFDLFGDFLSVPDLKYLHLIGGAKRNKFICKQLEKRLFIDYPEYYYKIESLFNTSRNKSGKNAYNGLLPPKKIRKKYVYDRTRNLISSLYPKQPLNGNSDTEHFVKEQNNPYLNEVFKYEKTIHGLLLTKFSRIPADRIADMEQRSGCSNRFLIGLKNRQESCRIHLNPFMEIIEAPSYVLQFNPYELLRGGNPKSVTVACIPQLFHEGYKETVIDDISINILAILLEETAPVSFTELVEKASDLFDRVDGDKDSIVSLLQKRIKKLVGESLIYLSSEK
jgi:hypothetical protein